MVNDSNHLPVESRTSLLRKSAILNIAVIAVGVIGFFVVTSTDGTATDEQTLQNHAFQFVLIAVLGVLMLVAVLARWVINRAHVNVWNREIVYGSHPEYSRLVRRCRGRLRLNATDKPLPDDPWSREALRKWNRKTWLVPVGIAAIIVCAGAIGYWFAELGLSGPLYTGIFQAMIVFPGLLIMNWRTSKMPPRVEEELYGQETIFDSPWYNYHGRVLDDLGFWFLVSGRAHGGQARGVYLNDAGYLVAELDDEHCRITTVLSDGTAIQTALRGRSTEIAQVVNATRSSYPMTDPAIALIGAFRLHQDAIDTAMKLREAAPIILAGNYAKALAFARWKTNEPRLPPSRRG
jgi:hypothetical protein